MPIALAIVGAGIIGAGASLIASHNADTTAANAAAANNALESQIYQTNVGLETPYINRGDAAGNELNGFLGLGGDPAATRKAFQTYLDSTGYQFNRNQGIAAINNDQAVSGLLDSGSTLKALDRFGTGLADTYGQQYVGNLENVSNTGASAANALAGEGENYGSQVSANNNNAATVAGNSAIAGANSINGLIGNAFAAYGLSKGGSSFLGGAGGNPFGTPTITYGG